MLPANIIHVGNSQHTSQLLRRHLHRPRGIGLPRLGLRKRRRSRGVKRHVAFHLLHRLVDVPVQHRHRAEFLQIRQRLRAIVCPPSPLRIHRPQWNVRKHHDRRARLQLLHVVFQPFELFVSQRSHSAGLLTPMWLSLICTTLSSPAAAAPAPKSESRLKLYDFNTPPCITHSAPVPAHAMHFRNPRRSIPSSLWSCTISSFTIFVILFSRTRPVFETIPFAFTERRELNPTAKCPRRSGTCFVYADHAQGALIPNRGIF